MKNLKIFLILMLLAACEKEKSWVGTSNKKQNIAIPTVLPPKTAKPKVINIKMLYHNTDSLYWTDNGSFWLLYFGSEKVHFSFYPSCDYSFPAKIKGDKIVFNLTSEMNCTTDLRFGRSFSGIKSPIIGKKFGEITLTSDSTLKITYYYKEWVAKINEAERVYIDTLFPESFRFFEF